MSNQNFVCSGLIKPTQFELDRLFYRRSRTDDELFQELHSTIMLLRSSFFTDPKSALLAKRVAQRQALGEWHQAPGGIRITIYYRGAVHVIRTPWSAFAAAVRELKNAVASA